VDTIGRGCCPGREDGVTTIQRPHLPAPEPGGLWCHGHRQRAAPAVDDQRRANTGCLHRRPRIGRTAHRGRSDGSDYVTGLEAGPDQRRPPNAVLDLHCTLDVAQHHGKPRREVQLNDQARDLGARRIRHVLPVGVSGWRHSTGAGECDSPACPVLQQPVGAAGGEPQALAVQHDERRAGRLDEERDPIGRPSRTNNGVGLARNRQGRRTTPIRPPRRIVDGTMATGSRGTASREPDQETGSGDERCRPPNPRGDPLDIAAPPPLRPHRREQRLAHLRRTPGAPRPRRAGPCRSSNRTTYWST
jgi:hypothetical protein